MMAAINEDNLFGAIVKGSLGLLAVLTLAGWVFLSARTGLGILAGGLIAVVNFFWLRNVLQRILGLSPNKPVLYAQMRFVARLTVSGVIIYLAITSGWFSLAGLLAGLSVVVITIIALSLYGALCAGG
ncbi:MAG TPA: ATP synthase subunit I [Desulfuromonadales bacterium]|nr:ATP synthase subunit I [Desulfuromonadales bacterium]